jgi:hypothetical protein
MVWQKWLKWFKMWWKHNSRNSNVKKNKIYKKLLNSAEREIRKCRAYVLNSHESYAGFFSSCNQKKSRVKKVRNDEGILQRRVGEDKRHRQTA